MRTLTRFILLGLLVFSCEDPMGPSVQDPEADCGTGPVRLDLFADSLHLVVGTFQYAWAEWTQSTRCGTQPLPQSELTWAVRDETVARDSGGPPELLVLPVRPGRTHFVIEGRGLKDSAVVFVSDTLAMEPLAALAAGGETSCGVSVDATTYCWGSSQSFQLGEPFEDPAVGYCWGLPCSPMPVPRATTLHGIAVGSYTICGLDDVGKAWCWGDNGFGQGGTSGGGILEVPTEVQGGLQFGALSLGTFHTCGLTPSGEAYCWGDHADGKLGGDQRSGSVASPEPVAGDLSFVSITARRETTCGVTQDGVLYCWGILGDASAALEGAEGCYRVGVKGGPGTNLPCAFTPYEMALDPAPTNPVVFQQVSGGCALTAAGAVYCHDASRGLYAERQATGPYTAIAGGDRHACGLTAAGAAACWGSNDLGQLGSGTNADSEHAVAVAGTHTFTALAAGAVHTCGLDADGVVWCWGGNDQGQAGTSVLDRPLVPVKVHGQD